MVLLAGDAATLEPLIVAAPSINVEASVSLRACLLKLNNVFMLLPFVYLIKPRHDVVAGFRR
jgi:hypothetical protein